jgi:hypothetical protein
MNIRLQVCNAVWLLKNRRFVGMYRLHCHGDKNHSGDRGNIFLRNLGSHNIRMA